LAVTVKTISPSDIGMPEIDHESVPLAVPLPPLELTQVTLLTPTLSEALPDKLIDELVAV
jgi:hypothetical protein